MKRLSAISTALIFVAAALFGCSNLPGPPGMATLVDGASGLDNFDRVGDANWRYEDGAIVADKAKVNSYLVTKNSYKDFQIYAEFWADHNTNSGVFLRLTDRQKITAENAYEVNIFDQRPDPSYGTGAIVNVAKVVPMPKAGGRWNTFLITARGDTLVVEFNGVQTVNARDGKHPAGPFALQFGNIPPKDAPGGVIKWRKVQIIPL